MKNKMQFGGAQNPNPYTWMNFNPQQTPQYPQVPERNPNEYAFMNFDDNPTIDNSVLDDGMLRERAPIPYMDKITSESVRPSMQTQIQKPEELKSEPKKRFDPYFALRGFSTGLSWLANKAERNRQDQYMYNQYSTLGQMDPVNLEDYQPTPYNQYFQKGGITPITVNNPNDPRLRAYKNLPTRQDSLDVYNQNNKVIDFYRKNGYNEMGVNPTINAIEEYDMVNSEGYYGDALVIKDNKQVELGPYSKDDQFKKIDKNKFYSRETVPGPANLNAPMQLLDRRINPKGLISFSKEFPTKNMTRNTKQWDVATVGYYDPIAVKPWDMLTKSEMDERIKKYGKPKPVQPVVYQKKEEPRLTRMPYSPVSVEGVNPIAGTLPPLVGTNIPAQDNNYRVEYTDPETGKETHRDFADEKQGSAFQKLIGGNRTGYWMKKKGGTIRKKTYL